MRTDKNYGYIDIYLREEIFGKYVIFDRGGGQINLCICLRVGRCPTM